MADPPQNGCSCGPRRMKNARLGVAPPPQRADVTPTSTGNGRCVARATQASPQVTNDTTDATCPSPTPPPFASRRNRPTPLHGAFRCHQTDGTPQPHARSKRENPPSWLSGGVERRPVNREGTTTSTTEPLRRVRRNRAKSLTSKAQHPTCPSARASATNGRLQLLRTAPKAPKERRR